MCATCAAEVRHAQGRIGAEGVALSGNGGSAGAAAELKCALESVLLRLGEPSGQGQREKPGICVAPGYGGDQRGKRAVLQANRIALAFGGEPQDAARELVGPHLAVAVELERQP